MFLLILLLSLDRDCLVDDSVGGGDSAGSMDDTILPGVLEEAEDDGVNKGIEEEVGDGYPVLKNAFT